MIALVFIFVAGFARGLAELLAFRHDRSLFSGARPDSFFGSKSDIRKYKYDKQTLREVLATGTWYERTFDLDYKEAFPGSTTIFVSFTDGFHFSNFIMRCSLTAAYMLAMTFPLAVTGWWQGILLTVAFFAAYSMGFFLSYNVIFQRK